MLEIQTWMRGYVAAVRAAFGDRVRYIGLQGSRARGEAGPDSDIDVVCILDACSLRDLETYRAAVDGLPEREKLCGFVSGAAELAAWDRADLFQFRITLFGVLARGWTDLPATASLPAHRTWISLVQDALPVLSQGVTMPCAWPGAARPCASRQ